MKKLIALICLFALLSITYSKNINVDLNDYLPKDVRYNSAVTTPKTFLGYQPGEYHIQYYKLINYLEKIATESDRIHIEQYGETYENRPLMLCTISSPQNLQNIEQMRTEHLKLADPSQSGNLSIEGMPAVVWLGYSVHGNEASGANSVPLVAYHLASAQGREIDNLLKNTVILIDPCINPDGYNRFSNWVNVYRGKNVVSDPNHLEHREAWPGGRTNHYWFDLNRDWLLAQHPESQGRLIKYHQWLPNILNDHHEMGTSSTYFFQPGVKSRNNPLIPEETYNLSKKIAKYHAKSLDEIGSLYFSEEQFDDYYFGKGSTYPDLHGCVGILFEQASSRGHVQENRFGELTFPFAIRNQFQTSIASLKAALDMRVELLENQRQFFKTSVESGKKSKVRGYVFAEEFDHSRLAQFIKLLNVHHIKINQLNKSVSLSGKSFSPENSFIVKLDQPQNRLIRTIFETQTSFKDSIFYDVSTWSMPLAFNLNYSEIENKIDKLAGKEINGQIVKKVDYSKLKEAYAYAIKWDDFYAPKALYELQSAGVLAHVISEEFASDGANPVHFDQGTIIIPAGVQKLPFAELLNILTKVSVSNGIIIYPISSGFTTTGADLGSPAMFTLNKPKILLAAGPGVSSRECGEIWHLLDQHYDMEVSLVNQDRIGSIDLVRYNVIILPGGEYSNVDSITVEKMKSWILKGNTLITLGSAIRWANKIKLGHFKSSKISPQKKDNTGRRPYANRSNDYGSSQMAGAIFNVNLDLTHPLAYGYHSPHLPVFHTSMSVLVLSEDPYATPAVYSPKPYLSGYTPKGSVENIANKAAIVVDRLGSGQVIAFDNNPTFRAFWYGTNKLLANAIFFGQIIY